MSADCCESKQLSTKHVCKECGREETRELQEERICCGQKMVRTECNF